MSAGIITGHSSYGGNTNSSIDKLHQEQAVIENVFKAIKNVGWKTMFEMFQEKRQEELDLIPEGSGQEEKIKHVERVYLVTLQQLETAFIHFGEDFDLTLLDNLKAFCTFHTEDIKSKKDISLIEEHRLAVNDKELFDELDAIFESQK